MAATCPRCNETITFNFAEQSAGYKVGQQMGTCPCGAIIKAKTSSEVEFVKNGSTLEASIS